MSEERVIPGGTPKWVRDATANDSDKSFTVPAGKVWEMLFMSGDLSTTATVGNRVLVIAIAPDGTNSVRQIISGSIAASGTAGCIVTCGSVTSIITLALTTTTRYTVGVSRMLLPAGAVIRIYDAATIDAAADDLTVVLHYIEYDA